MKVIYITTMGPSNIYLAYRHCRAKRRKRFTAFSAFTFNRGRNNGNAAFLTFFAISIWKFVACPECELWPIHIICYCYRLLLHYYLALFSLDIIKSNQMLKNGRWTLQCSRKQHILLFDIAIPRHNVILISV